MTEWSPSLEPRRTFYDRVLKFAEFVLSIGSDERKGKKASDRRRKEDLEFTDAQGGAFMLEQGTHGMIRRVMPDERLAEE